MFPPNNPNIFPPSTLGFALALCGAASVAQELMGNSFWFVALNDGVQKIYTWLALLLTIVYSSRALVYWHVLLHDLAMPNIIPNYAAGQMALLFLTLHLLGPGDAAYICVYILSVAQLIIMALFLQRCWVTGMLPEPFWNPPTVNCAVTTIVAAALDMPPWLVRWSFGLAIVLQFSIVPIQCYRVICGESEKSALSEVRLSSRRKVVANNISIALLQAPCSLTVVAWGAMRRNGFHALPFCEDNDETRCGDCIEHTLFACCMAVLALTGIALWQRRKSIFAAGFSPAWAATTFPTCSSAIACLQYSGFYRGDLATPEPLRGRNNTAAAVLRVCAAAFAAATSLFVLVVVVLFFWLQGKVIREACKNVVTRGVGLHAGPIAPSKSRLSVAADEQAAIEAKEEAERWCAPLSRSSPSAAPLHHLEPPATNRNPIPRTGVIELPRV